MKTGRNKKIPAWQLALSVAFWLVVWQVVSMLINEVLFLPSPLSTLQALWRLAVVQPLSATSTGAGFWQSVGGSLLRIGMGFLLGLVAGVLLAAASAAATLVEVLLRPLMQLLRAVPVASFIILVLVWVNSRWLSVVISFLIVLPVIYGGTLSGIRQTPVKLLEMAQVFRIPFWRRVRALYIPATMPSLLTSCELAVGMCWKSGIAAEVIGLPQGTIGERLYQAKIYLMTPDLFAWTVVIILLSWLFGSVVLGLLRLAAKRMQRGRTHG